MKGLQMLERHIEQNLIAAVKRRGGLAMKFLSGIAGVPDRLVLLPQGQVCFIETKRSGEKMRPQQIKRKRQLEQLGFLVYCIDSVEKIEEVLDEICAT